MFKQPRGLHTANRRRRFSPLMLIGISVPVILALIAGGVFLASRIGTHAAADNMDCTLILPDNPLSAQGLATPFQLVATNPANGPCHEANKAQAAFVQGAVVDPVTGQISIYNPLVIDQGTQPAIQPTMPTLPPGAVVALWFGSNGMNLTLQGNTLNQANCVNGVQNSIFGQFAYCNASAFFAVANQAIQAGKLKVPPLGMGNDNKPCPTVRDFSIIDMDQSDNVATTYIITPEGKTAQATATNMKALQNIQVQVNASDNRLLDVAVDGALNCTPWMAPDLADPGNMVPALPLNELQASKFQGPPMALVPLGDPMVLNNGKEDLNKVDMYRLGVDQPTAGALDQASTLTYCQSYVNIALERIVLDKTFTANRPSPDPAAANSLFTFLAQRLSMSLGADGLNCLGLLKIQNPVQLTTDNNGVVTDAVITVAAGNAGGANAGNVGAVNAAAGQAATPNCAFNGQAINGCNGTFNVNGQACTVMFDAANNAVNLACPAKQ